MRTGKKRQPSRSSGCPECRHGLIGSPEWESWYARCDEAERAGSGVPSFLLDEVPEGEPEIECPTCGGTGALEHRFAAA